MYPISIKPFGPHAILLEWPNEVEEAILEDILQFVEHLKRYYLNSEDWEMVTSYNSLTLIHRKGETDFKTLRAELQKWYSEKGNTALGQKFLWKLPVCYESQFGIDLPEVAEKLDKSIPEIIAMHTENIYTVYGIGFLPGFMYLGGLPKSLEVPRKSTPRLKVAKGSVGLAGKQTGIYPQESPGGWNIIGNCSIPMFDAKKDNPCFVSVGDKIQFQSISKAEYDLHKIEGEVGIYKLEKLVLDA